MDRIWRDARNIGELGAAMAGWLEGAVDSRPGYTAARPDGETDHLVPVLARLNRRGYVTTDSQPGMDGPAFDGRRWVQRAAVQGYIAAGDPLLNRIIRGARAAGLLVSAHGGGRAVGPARGLVATRWGNEPHTGFGGRPARGQHAPELSGAGRRARRQLRREGVLLAVIDPVWGRDTVLWPALDRAIGYRVRPVPSWARTDDRPRKEEPMTELTAYPESSVPAAFDRGHLYSPSLDLTRFALDDRYAYDYRPGDLFEPMRRPDAPHEWAWWARNIPCQPVPDFLGLRVGDRITLEMITRTSPGEVVATERGGAVVRYPLPAGDRATRTHAEMTVRRRNPAGHWYP